MVPLLNIHISDTGTRIYHPACLDMFLHSYRASYARRTSALSKERTSLHLIDIIIFKIPYCLTRPIVWLILVFFRSETANFPQNATNLSYTVLFFKLDFVRQRYMYCRTLFRVAFPVLLEYE